MIRNAMKYGQVTITMDTREHSNLIHIQSHYENGFINRQFKHSFSMSAIYCKVM